MSNNNDRLAGLSLEEKRELLAQKLKAKMEKSRSFPLSYNQRRIWLVEQMTPGNSGLNIPLTARLRGSLNVETMEQAVNHMIRRHETLRTSFSMVEGEPVQTIHPSLKIPLQVVDLRHLRDPYLEAERQASEDATRPFDITQAPLMRAVLFHLEVDDYIFHLVLHHLVADGWSLGIYIRELGVIYNAILDGLPPPLSPMASQYADFVHWQRNFLQSDVVETQLAYWRQQLASSPPLLPLPTDSPRPPVQTYNGGHLTLALPRDLAQSIKQLSRSNGATLFMTLLSAYKILLGRFTGLDDIPVGSPISGRNRSEVEGLIGVFINNIVLRTDLSGNPTFQELLQRTRTVALGAYEHQDIPFEQLLEELHPKRDLSHSPVFQVFFNMLNFGVTQLQLSGVTVELFPPHEIGSNFDITLYGVERDDMIELLLVYNIDLYRQERMQKALEQYEFLLEQIVQHSDWPINRYSLATSNAGLPDMGALIDISWEGSITSRFTQNAEHTPDHPALIDSKDTWPYGELHIRSNQLANYLLTSGIGAGDVVAIYGHRSASLIWALLGIAKAGAAFLILDPDYPAARLLSYLELAPPQGIIQLESAGPLPETLSDYLTLFPPRCSVELPTRSGLALNDPFANISADNLGIETDPDGLAYLNFTSGTTGRPKGIAGTWRPLSHFLAWHVHNFGLNPNDRFTMLSGLSHDPLLRDVFTPLWLGGTLCIPNGDDIFSPTKLARWMKEQAVTVIHLTPAMGQIVSSADGEDIPSLRYAFFGGDLLGKRDVHNLQAVAPHVVCVNFYGATETPQAMGYYIVPGDNSETGVVNTDEAILIGKGIEGVQLLLLNNNGQLAGVSEVGEIYVRTPYLTRGYLGDDALTQERYLANPNTGDETDRLYKTGDLGRYQPDGQIAYFGRRDQQVKIRGFRIELGEIETILTQYSAVRQAVLLVREDTPGEKRLAAYVVLKQANGATPTALREFLKDRLPSYMIPSSIGILDALPLTPNGKIDRRALLATDVAPMAKEQGVVELSATETIVADIWRTLLKVEHVSPVDNFFDLGGHSLLAMQVIAQIEKNAGVQLMPASLRYQTLKQLAASIGAAQLGGTVHELPPLTTSKNLNRPSENREIPLYFGASEAPLFGMYYQPIGNIESDFGVVICPPWGQEYIRAHRAIHQLALRLSNVGIPVFRFDYYGTGDSAGDDLSSTIGQGLQDTSAAMDELRARSGVKSIVLVGLRLGATMAALAGASLQNVKGLVLWDPVVNGSAYLDELKAWHRKNLWYYLADIQSTSVPSTLEVLGFALSETMLDELRQLDMRTMDKTMPERILLVEREANEATGQLQVHLQNQGVIFHYQQIDGPQMWTENPDKALVPHQTLEAIVAWMTEE